MRLEKRASFGWPATSAQPAPCRNGMVAHYDGSNQGLAGKSHEACRDYWKNTRRFHMGPSRGWVDIGYSFGVCPHGVVFEGRGFGRAQAAQPGGNTTWTSCTFMSGDSERPTAVQLQAWRELRAWLRGEHGVAAAVKGHRDFISTSCPGGLLYEMVRDGTLSRAPEREDDDMQLDDRVVVPDDFDDQYSQPNYSVGWMLSAGPAETRKLAAKVDQLSAAVAELKALIQAKTT